MSDTLLATALHRAATLIGDRLPGALSMDTGPMLLDGDTAAHVMPDDAVAVRFALGEDEGVLVLAIPADAAAMLRSGPPEVTLPEALAGRVLPGLHALADLFGGAAPQLGEGEEVSADEALATGPGDAVSVSLVDTGVHRATLALRLVVTDAMLAADDETPDNQDPDDPVVAQQPPVPVRGATGVAAGHGPATRQPFRDPIGPPAGDAHPADFASFDQLRAMPGLAHPLTMLGDVEMGVTAELGRTRLTVREILALNQGSIIELDRAAGAPVDVVVNGTLIARGEVVVIDEEFGIRITEIVGMDSDAPQLPMAQ